MGGDQYINDKFEGDLHFCKKCNAELTWSEGRRPLESGAVTGSRLFQFYPHDRTCR